MFLSLARFSGEIGAETGFVGDFNPSFETEKGSLKEETSSLKGVVVIGFLCQEVDTRLRFFIPCTILSNLTP